MRLIMRRWRLWWVIGWMLCTALVVGAQDEALPLTLRYGGTFRLPSLPLPAELYEIGAVEMFYVAKKDAPAPVQIQARLAAISPSLYYWLEDGIDFNEDALAESAAVTEGLYNFFRSRAVYTERLYNPIADDMMFVTDLLPIPDVDNFPITFVLFIRDGIGENAVYVPAHSQPPENAPTGITHRHETILVNTSALVDVRLDDTAYQRQVMNGLFDMITFHNNPSGASWRRAAAFDDLIRAASESPILQGEIEAFLANPNTSLIQPATAINRSAASGLTALFSGYLRQRYGDTFYSELVLQPGAGMSALDDAFAREGIIDLTGVPLTGRAFFTDFMLANVINRRTVGDGRYLHREVPLPDRYTIGAAQASSSNVVFNNQTVAQFGAGYFVYTSVEGETITVSFDGDDNTPRLIANESADKSFFWSGNTQAAHRTMTREVDLRDAQTAALQFDIWHDLAPYWNYGYITVSTDGGTTWQIVPDDSMRAEDPYGNAYGLGYTGASNPEGARPFPQIGVRFDVDGVTAIHINEGGAAAQAGMQDGDVVLQVDGTAFEPSMSLIELLEERRVGETLDFVVGRGDEQVTLSVVLSAHPARVIQASPIWQNAVVDLSAYVGQVIQVGFETVGLPGHEDRGIALDNPVIVVDESAVIDLTDAGGWTLDGWQSVGTEVDQMWIVYLVQTGNASKPPRVLPLIAPESTAHTASLTITLDPNESVFIAVTAANDDTVNPSNFSLRLQGENAPSRSGS